MYRGPSLCWSRSPIRIRKTQKHCRCWARRCIGEGFTKEPRSCSVNLWRFVPTIPPPRPCTPSLWRKWGAPREAEAACQRLLAKPPADWDLDVSLTYVEILDETHRPSDAMTYVDKVLQSLPQNPIALFWKARLLLQSGRLEEAAKQAEQSVSFAPGLPLARNLLVQIYRRQGRTEDAQRQADWLREYNDRMTGQAR